MVTKKIFFIIWLLGLMSGFTIMISGNTLNFWLSKENIDIKTIGAFALISLPYAINFIWAPVFDSVKLPVIHKIFGQRISWVVLIQISLCFFVYLISRVDPSEELIMVAIYGVAISFLSSAQDTVLGALRTEIVDKNKQGEISGMYIFGYRIGMIISSSGAIYASQYIQWGLVYKIFSVAILFFPLILIFAFRNLVITNQPSTNNPHEQKNQEKTFLSKILKPIGDAKYIALLLLFLVLYRLPDNFISMMINPFLIHIGYDEFQISTAGKLFGTSAAMIGGLLASYIMKKKNIYNSLFIFGAIHAFAHILFVIQEIYGKNIYILFVVTGFEGVSGGMAMSAYIALIASLCHGKFRATQYSFLSSMMGLSRAIFPALSGYIVATFGWAMFYIFTSLATIPSLIVILYLRNYREKSQKQDKI